MSAMGKTDWALLASTTSALGSTIGVITGRWKPVALTLAILVTVASCTDDGPPEGSTPSGETPDALPPAVLGMAGPLGGQSVTYLSGDESTVGYLAVPEGSGPFPALILIHEWNGLVDRVREVADAMAAEGYVALAADLYSGQTGSNPDENMALMSEHLATPEALISNLDAAARFLRDRDDVTGRVGTLGWCFGGGVALSYALGGEAHQATAIFYGSLVTDPTHLASIDHEVYGSFAEMDNGIPPETVNEFVSALRAAGVDHDVHIYDEVNHGFWLRIEEDRALREEPGLDAWRRLKGYLARTLSD
jgi:carboxymethylenebutenolidase